MNYYLINYKIIIALNCLFVKFAENKSRLKQ